MKKIKNNITYGCAGLAPGKKYKTYCLVFVIGIFALGILNSCKKLIVPNPPGSNLATSTVFTDSVTAQAAIAGMYNTISSATYTETLPTRCSFTADELNYLTTGYNQFTTNTIPVTDPDIESIWSSSYSIIFQANSIIAGVTNSTTLSASFRNRSLGEALFIRSLCYFYLVNLYGDVPLILGADLGTNETAPRTATAAVYSQIISDLKLAQSYLPANYTFVTGSARTRANKFAATALLARVYLYQSDWVDAEAQATTVINSTLFALPDDLTTVFTPASQEAIFQFYNSATGYTYYAATVLPNPVTLVPYYSFTSEQLAAFQAGDKRRTTWVASLVYSGTTYYYPYKYKNLTTGANAEYYTVLRIAEQYLIRAEARAEQNNTSGAITDLNAIHNPGRVNLPLYAGATDQASVLTAIMNERQVELFAEWGHRWFDLKRTNTANTVLGAEKPTWKSTDVLFPIPQTERTNNSNLTQNPGY